MDYIGLVIYCVLLYIRPADWVPAVKNWPLESVTLCLTIAWAAVRIYFFSDDEERSSRLPMIWFLAAWVAVILLSNVLHGNTSAGMEQGNRYLNRAIICLTFGAVLASTKRLRGLLFILVPLAGLLGLQGIYQVQHGYGWAGQPLYWAGRICWIGLWDGANVLSLLFVATLPFAIEVIFGKWSVWAKLIAIASLGLVIEGLILAASRGAWISLAVILVLSFRQRLGRRGLILAVVCLAALAVVGPSRLTHNAEADSDDSSARHRVDMWAEGMEMFKSSPVIGIGKGQFLNYTGMLIAHNSFVQNMGETGLLGLFSWIGLIYLSFKGLRLVRRHFDEISPQLRGITEATFVSLVGYLSASMFISTDFDLLYVLLGISAAVLAAACAELKGKIEVQFNWIDLKRIAGLVVMLVIFLHVVTAVLS